MGINFINEFIVNSNQIDANIKYLRKMGHYKSSRKIGDKNMLRWLVRSTVAGSANSNVKSESSRASRKANDAKRQFDYAKREKDLDKKMTYLAEGMSYLAESVEHVSNTTVPLAKVAFAASLLVENVQDNLDEQTKDIVKQLKE